MVRGEASRVKRTSRLGRKIELAQATRHPGTVADGGKEESFTARDKDTAAWSMAPRGLLRNRWEGAGRRLEAVRMRTRMSCPSTLGGEMVAKHTRGTLYCQRRHHAIATGYPTGYYDKDLHRIRKRPPGLCIRNAFMINRVRGCSCRGRAFHVDAAVAVLQHAAFMHMEVTSACAS